MSIGVGGLAFTRLVDIPFGACVAILQRCCMLGPSRLTWSHSEVGMQGWKARVDLGGVVPWRRVAMELRLLPWSSLRGMTQIELVPRGRARGDHRYFAAGHAFLDQLMAELQDRAVQAGLIEAS